ncbi:MFS transporter [Streptomyces sulphureus]|uniref:MFS transporter n=1 Tax=Streptomyces sulphureus TaxID=47758 RepID=UPI00036B5E86|nr:MFS transporter [Streptomyces sulphureus]
MRERTALGAYRVRVTRQRRGQTVASPAGTGEQTEHPEAGQRPGYGRLLRTSGARTFVLTGYLARQPFAMLAISILLLVQHTTGSYGTAGAVSAASGLAFALLAPQSGKLADRFGQRAVLVPGVMLHAAAVSVLVTLALAQAPTWTLFVAAVPTGGTAPQAGPMVRARWAAKLGGSPLASTAAAFESVTDEFTFVVGPVIATALCTGVHPAAGLVAEGAVTLVGGLLFAAQGRTQPAPVRSPRTQSGQGTRSALGVPGTRVLAIAVLGIGIVFGGMQVSLTAFTESIGRPEANGVMYGVFAAGNMLAALAVGALRSGRGPRTRLLTAYPLLVLATLALAAAAQWGTWAVLLGGLGLLTGLCVAPCMITCFTLTELLVPAGVRTEAFTWLTGAIAFGQALGSTVAGQLADGMGANGGFLTPLAGTALALAVLAVFRGALDSPAREALPSRGVGHREGAAVD